MTATAPPGPEVMAAFGVSHVLPQPLPGRQGATWIADDIVLKRVTTLEEAEWAGSVLSDIPEQGFRISRPQRSRSGAWTAAGWAASRRVAGSHDFTPWYDVLAAGAAFHLALRDVPRPAFLDERVDVWSLGDRAAWDDGMPDVVHSELRPLAEELANLRCPTELPSQVIHGDLSGNVLFADPSPPAIIDFVAYWRPAAFGLAIVVADAICWHRAGLDLACALPPGESRRSMLARAGLYRLVTSDLVAQNRHDHSAYLHENVAAHLRLLEVLRAL